jgi:Zn-dependent protease
MRHRCSRCGFTSETPSFFRREKGGLLQRLKTVCDACTAYQPTAYEHRTAIRYFFGSGSVLAVSLLLSHGNPGFGAAVIIMTMTAALTLRLRIFIHEWGHAFAARQVGTQVWQIDVGSGPLSYKRRFNGFIFNIHRYTFTGGKTWHSPVEGNHIGRRTAAILLAGPMANFLSAVLAIALAYAFFSLTPYLLPLTVVLSGFTLASIVMGLRNLIPQTYADPEPAHSDGMQLLHLFQKERAQPKISIELRAIWLTRAHRYSELIQAVGDDWRESHLRLFLASSLMDALSKVRGDQAVSDFYTARCDRLVIPGRDEDYTAIAWIVGNAAWRNSA